MFSKLVVSSLLLASVQGAFVCRGNSTAGPTYNASTTYLGCYTDARERTLTGLQNNNVNNSPQACANYCRNLGYKNSAVEYTSSIARANSDGDLLLYPGKYDLTLDNDGKVKVSFELTEKEVTIDMLPRRAASYNYTVQVHPQA